MDASKKLSDDDKALVERYAEMCQRVGFQHNIPKAFFAKTKGIEEKNKDELHREVNFARAKSDRAAKVERKAVDTYEQLSAEVAKAKVAKEEAELAAQTARTELAEAERLFAEAAGYTKGDKEEDKNGGNNPNSEAQPANPMGMDVSSDENEEEEIVGEDDGDKAAKEQAKQEREAAKQERADAKKALREAQGRYEQASAKRQRLRTGIPAGAAAPSVPGRL